MTIEQLQEKRNAALAAIADLRNTKLDEQGRFLDENQEAQWQKHVKDIEAIDAQIRAISKEEELKRNIAMNEYIAQQTHRDQGNASATKAPADEYAQVFMRYLSRGINGMTPEEVKILTHREQRGTNPQITTSDSAGGYLVPTSFSNELTSVMEYYAPMLQFCRVYDDVVGGTLEWPTGDDTGNDGSIQTTEGAAVAVQDMTFGQVVFGHYTFTSGIVKVSRQLLQDERVGLLQGVLTSQLGERLGRNISAKLTNGTGTSEPYGLTTTVTNRGKETASQTAFTKPELIDLQHSVNRAYRNSPNVGWMMNDSILAAARKLDVGNTDTVQIFQAGVVQGEPDRLLGQQIFVNNDITGTQAQSAKIMYYGDFSKYVIRRIRGIGIERNDNAYWNELNVGFMGWTRLDGNLVDASAIKYLQNKTT